MRCFIAIEISQPIRDALGEMMKGLKAISRGIKWVPAGNIHLTLKFLGEVKEELIPEIRKRLAEVCNSHSPAALAIRGAGAFPNLRSPQVIWVGCGDSPELKVLYEAIEEAMSGLGFEKERRKFSPHLTLGRVREQRGLEPVMKELQLLKDQDWGTVEVGAVALMQSVLKPSGAEYTPVSVFPLGQ
ncbi:MAG: RNA 2',3'-cyclic phosphodiesterase [Nitrospirales bacterium]|nr:RNA 2',3'-cyclic phosphodiesterase [Nitrospirales bacterium]